jgi:hypothetical protein
MVLESDGLLTRLRLKLPVSVIVNKTFFGSGTNEQSDILLVLQHDLYTLLVLSNQLH